MNEISDSFKIQWLNKTLKFVKSNDFDIIKYPEMPLSHVEYLQKLIRQHEIFFDLEFNALYAPLWKAMKLYRWKVVINKSDGADTGQIILEKVSGNTELEKDIIENLSMSFPRKSTNTKSNKPKKPRKENPFFLANRKMMESVSETFLKTSLQKMLHFINTESEASIIFTDLDKMEGRFFQIFVIITRKYRLFELLLSPGCCDLFNKISRKFEENTVKLVVTGPRMNKWRKKSEITFTKAPIYERTQLRTINTSANNANDQKHVDTCNENSCLKIESKKSLLQLYNTILEDKNKDDPQTKLMKSIESIGNSDNLNDEPHNDIFWKSKDGNEKNENSDNSNCDRNIEYSSILSDEKTNNGIVLEDVDRENTQTKQSSNIENTENSDNSDCDRNIEYSSILNDDKTNNDIVLEDLGRENTQTKQSSNIENTENSDNSDCDRPYNDDRQNKDVVLEDLDGKISQTKKSNSTKTKIYYAVEEATRDLNKCKSRPLPNHIIFTKADGRQKEETTIDLKQNHIEKLTDYWCPRIVKLLEDLSVPLESERGLRIMRSMGWSGGALGPRGNGIADPILPVLDQKRRAGLGHKSTKSVLDQTEVAVCNFILENILEMFEYDKSITVIPFTRILTKREMDSLIVILKSLNNRFNADLMFPEGVERDMVNKVLEQMFLEPNVSVDIEFSGDCEVIILKRKYNSEKPETKKKKKRILTETTLLEHYNLCSITIRLTSLDDFKTIIISQILYLLKSNDSFIYLNFNKNLKSVYYEYVDQVCASFNNKQVIGCRLTKELAIKVVKNIGDAILGVNYGRNGRSISFTKVKMKSAKELEDWWNTI